MKFWWASWKVEAFAEYWLQACRLWTKTSIGELNKRQILKQPPGVGQLLQSAESLTDMITSSQVSAANKSGHFARAPGSELPPLWPQCSFTEYMNLPPTAPAYGISTVKAQVKGRLPPNPTDTWPFPAASVLCCFFQPKTKCNLNAFKLRRVWWDQVRCNRWLQRPFFPSRLITAIRRARRAEQSGAGQKPCFLKPSHSSPRRGNVHTLAFPRKSGPLPHQRLKPSAPLDTNATLTPQRPLFLMDHQNDDFQLERGFSAAESATQSCKLLE